MIFFLTWSRAQSRLPGHLATMQQAKEVYMSILGLLLPSCIPQRNGVVREGAEDDERNTERSQTILQTIILPDVFPGVCFPQWLCDLMSPMKDHEARFA